MEPEATTPRTAPARETYTVSRLNREARALLEGSFPPILVEGEISNLARPASGHVYFCLKDAHAQVRCALFRSQLRSTAFAPRDGMHVVARARVTLYEGRGEYQLIVEQLEDAGEGQLRRAFDALKVKLAAEGLFDLVRKRALPRLPKRIGLITSPTGAVLHDILTTLRRRFPAIPVLLYPVPVQGKNAAIPIAQALHVAGTRRECDVLILARGGGSLEDLWGFNEEVVARAIVACPIPVVSGVGHETDFTIADLAADLRAPTPTAAAELASPDQTEWLDRLRAGEARLVRGMRDRLRERAQHLDWSSGRGASTASRSGCCSRSRAGSIAHISRCMSWSCVCSGARRSCACARAHSNAGTCANDWRARLPAGWTTRASGLRTRRTH
jgi:exodeoxyribonuclease VII large subunit